MMKFPRAGEHQHTNDYWGLPARPVRRANGKKIVSTDAETY